MATHENNKKTVISDMVLPDEMMFEILSWLPIKSSLRFKCVCKIWCSTIEDPIFIDKQMKQGRFEIVYEGDQDTEFTAITTNKGVTLERRNSGNTYRLRNPATKQVLNLPTPSDRKGICTSICYIRSTNEIKVVYIDSLEQGNKVVLIYNVLRVGTDFAWKRVDSPLLGNLTKTQPSVRPRSRVIGSVFYNVRLVGDLYVDCLDLEDDSITTTKIPLNLFYEWKNVLNVNWRGKLSFACIEQERLNVRVLENYRNHKWDDSKIVIPLTFLRDYLDSSISFRHIIPCVVEHNMVYCTTTYQPFSFDIQSKEINCLAPFSTQRKLLYIYKPSLLPLRVKVKHPQRQIEETQQRLLFKFLRLSLFIIIIRGLLRMTGAY